MRLHYFVREFSESEQFPEVHIFTSASEARRTMIIEAFEAAHSLDGWVTDIMDGDPVTLQEINAVTELDSLNVQRDGGAVDCFRLMAQDVEPIHLSHITDALASLSLDHLKALQRILSNAIEARAKTRRLL